MSHIPIGDSKDYLLLAKGEVAQVTSFHRYRVLVPLFAGLLAQGISQARDLFGGAPGMALGLSFYLINTTILALAGTYIYRTARFCSAGVGPALVGAGAVLSSGLATYLVGNTLVDSLAVLVVAALYYALATQARALLWWAMVGSLLAKEQLLLVLLVAFYYGCFLPWPQRLAAVALAGALLLGLHVGLDALYPVSAVTPIANTAQVFLDHLRSATLPTLFLLATPKGISNALSVFGGFNLVLILGALGGRAAYRTWTSRLPPATGALLAVVFGFILLSGEVERMLFFAAPMFGVTVALIVQHHPLAQLLSQRLRTSAE